MKLIITRHGQTEGNKRNILQGSIDIPLSKEGKEQVKKLALRLKEHKIEYIYTSPLKRALETANAIKKYHPNAKLVIENELKEMNFGIFEGLTKEEITAKYKKYSEERERNKFYYKIPNGESYEEVELRVLKVLNKIINSGKDTIIVAHATVNKLFFMKLLNKGLEEINKNLYNNTSVSTFNIDKDKVLVEEFNCDRHLREYRKNTEGYFFDNKKNILAYDSGKGYLIFPGGGVENEMPEEAMKREVLEETGAIVEIEKNLGIKKFDYDENWAKTERQIERYEQFQGEEMHFFTGKIEKFTKINKKEDSWKGEKLMPLNNVIEIIEKDKENEFRKVQLKFLKNLQNSKNI